MTNRNIKQCVPKFKEAGYKDFAYYYILHSSTLIIGQIYSILLELMVLGVCASVSLFSLGIYLFVHITHNLLQIYLQCVSWKYLNSTPIFAPWRVCIKFVCIMCNCCVSLSQLYPHEQKSNDLIVLIYNVMFIF